jgi:adenosylmethionine-8-amino-7-oxononanoate aminotransferase
MCGVELDPPVDGLRWGRLVSAACVRRGVLVRPLGDTVVLMPMLTSTAAEIERIIDTLGEAIQEVCSP